MSRIRVDIVFGTRPEAIKLVELVRLLRDDDRFAPRAIITGQHRDMPEEILLPLGVPPDVDLAVMKEQQSLNDIFCRIIPRLEPHLTADKPRIVVVQGDTSSAFAAALTAFHLGIPVAHVEAGLRSFDRFHPYPEEANRRMLSCVTDIHFAPTAYAAENLMREGVPRQEVIVTGNTVVDTLLEAVKRDGDGFVVPRCEGSDGRLVLVTLHRREAWQATPGQAAVIEQILEGIRHAAEKYPSVDFVYPVHHNPRVGEPARRILAGLANVHLLSPLPYIPFVHLMSKATAILTDSGGIQEEAPSLGVPVLVLRRTTERPEGLPSQKRLIGASADQIVEQLGALLDEYRPRAAGIPRPSPFGDGRASARIRDAFLHFMGRDERPEEFGEPRPMHIAVGPLIGPT